MKRFTVRLLILGGLFLALSYSLQLFSLPFWPEFLTSHAQGPEIKKFFVFDAHMHPMSAAYRGGWNIGDSADPQFSLSMARQGGLGAVFVNTSIDEFYAFNHIAVKEILRQFNHVYGQIAMYPDQIGMARNAQEVRELQKQGKLAVILSISGGSAIESDLTVLPMLHRLGLRLISPMHFYENSIGDVGTSTKNNGMGSGLTPFGRDFVAEMNRLGIVIDLAHASEQTSRDIIEASTQPVINSHVAARGVLDRTGNWSDEMMRVLARKGGVICVPTGLPQRVSRAFSEKYPGRGVPRSRITGTGPLLYTGDPSQIYDFINERNQENELRLEAQRRERYPDIPPLSDYIEHVDYMVKVMGVDHVGISSDWGYPKALVKGIENAGEYQNIAQALLRRGYSDEDVAKIMGGNVLRFFDEVVKTAPKLTN
ncbi:MAG: dipeptidase [Acidobacteria bacterium]|nr:dipeptidase [Acidobacteriota bacterium]